MQEYRRNEESHSQPQKTQTRQAEQVKPVNPIPVQAHYPEAPGEKKIEYTNYPVLQEETMIESPGEERIGYKDYPVFEDQMMNQSPEQRINNFHEYSLDSFMVLSQLKTDTKKYSVFYWRFKYVGEVFKTEAPVIEYVFKGKDILSK